MNLPVLDGTDLVDRRVIVRCDFDFGESLSTGLGRIETVLPTIKRVVASAAQTILIGHRGRPENGEDPNLSLEPLVDFLGGQLTENLTFIPYAYLDNLFNNGQTSKIVLVENLRFWPEESSANEELAAKFAQVADIYINEAFSISHRKHMSTFTLPKKMLAGGKKGYVGLRFAKEVENLEKVLANPQRPVVVIFGGVKEDKLTNIEAVAEKADKVLIAGRLPEYVHDASPLRKNDKFVVANLMPDREDITMHSIEAFEKEIALAKTIVLAGPPGKYEDEAHAQGTKRIFAAIAQSNAYKVAAGGDTEEAVATLSFTDAFDWISVGGGAALEFLAKGTLPGIEALLT